MRTSSAPRLDPERPPRPFARLVLALAPIAVLIMTLRPITDPDAAWHVLGGQHVWATHRLVGPDPFGSFATLTWVQHEWLGELVMAGAYAVGGYAGLVTLVVALALALYAVLQTSAVGEADPLSRAIVALVVMVGVSGSLGARPQLFSLVLLAVTARAWRDSAADGRIRWWLVPLGWLWACIHGLWLAGALLGAAVVVGMALQRDHSWSVVRRAALVPILCVMAAGLTPIGPQLLLAPLTVRSYADLVTEWAPPDIHLIPVATTAALIAFTAALWFRQGRRVPWTDVLLWVMALGWALLYSRTVALGAIIVGPLAAGALAAAVRTGKDGGRARVSGVEGRALGASLLVCLIIAAFLAPVRANMPGDMPTAFDTELDALPSRTVVFNDDWFGGWLLLNHPQVRGVVDSRSEIYPRAWWEDWIAARAGLPGWEDFFTRTGATVALVKAESPIVTALRSAGWDTVAERDHIVMLTKP